MKIFWMMFAKIMLQTPQVNAGDLEGKEPSSVEALGPT